MHKISAEGNVMGELLRDIRIYQHQYDINVDMNNM